MRNYQTKKFSMKKSALILYFLISVFIAFLTYSNKALFYHHTSLYTDSFPQISLLSSKKFISKLLTSELSLYTHGEYRPLPFLVVALVKSTLKKYFNPNLMHLLLIFVHFLNTVIFFSITKSLVSEFSALLLSLLFLVHPLFFIMINDPNQTPISFGLLFSLLSFYLYIRYMESNRKTYFLFSLLSFSMAMISSKLSLFVPIFICLFHTIGTKYKKITLGISIYLITILMYLKIFGIRILFLFPGALLFVLIFALSTLNAKKDLFSLSYHLIPFLVIILAWYITSIHVGIKPVFEYPLSKMDTSHILKPFDFYYIWKSIFKEKLLYILLLIPFFIVPFLLGNEIWQNIILSGFAIFFITFSISLSNIYETDEKYWQKFTKNLDDPVSLINLAYTYIYSGKYEQAKNILYGLKFEGPKISDLIEDTINVELGILYHREGKEKIAAYYFLQKPKGALPGASKIAKWRLIPIGDFFFDLGYLSYAENYYASALVLDPYDWRIYKKLGKVLVYKNFLRASLRYFDKVLSINPYDKETLLYAAFSTKLLQDKDKYDYYKRKLLKLTKEEKLDFDPIYAQFNKFDRDKTRAILSGDPVVLFYTGETEKKYIYKLNGKEFVFWEVPLEIGKYFYRRGNYDAAIAFLSYAKEIGGSKEAEEYLRMAQQRKAMPTQEEIIRAIKEQEMVEKIMREKGIKSPWELMQKR